MTDSDARDFVSSCDWQLPIVEDWKFKSENQLGVLLLRRSNGYKYEVHVHFAQNGNGILTGANVRWDRQSQHESVALDTRTRAVQFCEGFLGEATNYNFNRNSGTRDDI